MKKIQIYTDGSCLGNPGPGGYGAILRYNDKEKELSQGYKLTTNNRMEIMAALVALQSLKEPCEIVLCTDSQYLKNALEGWIFAWQKNNWKTANKKPVKNVDLWLKLIPEMKKHKVTFQWQRGHQGHLENERCDELARLAASSKDLIEDTDYIQD